MSIWTTQSLDRDRDYIVLQHSLRGVNYTIMGVKFRDGYAVVEKNSKTHQALKKIPMLRTAKEFPLLVLKNLKFITKTLDVQFVFGKDVYNHYVKQLQAHIKEEKQELKEESIVKHLEENIKCKSVLGNSELCQQDALKFSPSGYCQFHLFNDPRLEEFGIIVPPFMTKKDRKEFRKEVNTKLEKLKQQGKF